LIIVEEIKMNLLAKSCFAPGLISMISNLFASAGDAQESG
jgi:acetyl-CoA C-acetyltransferase/potassium large conductance calcium-activated channel subfamily M alpha protein 1